MASKNKDVQKRRRFLIKTKFSEELPPPKKRKFDVEGFIKVAEKARKVFEEEERLQRERRLSSELGLEA